MSEPEVTPAGPSFWLKGILDIGHAFGVSAILLAFYMLQSAGVIPNPLQEEVTEVKETLIAHIAATELHNKEAEKHYKQALEDAKARQLRCVLKAKDENEKRACFPKE